MAAWNPAQLRAAVGVEPIVGFRAWRLVVGDDGPRLAPTTPRPVWPPRAAPAATCSGSHTRLYLVFDPTARPHRCPDEGCTCGWHAARDVAALVRPGGPAAVVGQVSMWGKVVEHARGYRAEHAYPARIRLVCSRCVRTGRWPAIPSFVMTDGERAEPACDAHTDRARGRRGVPLDARSVQTALLDAYAVDLFPVELLPLAERVDLLTRLRRGLEP